MTASSAKLGRPAEPLQGQSSPLLLTQKTELIGEVAQAMANHFNNIMMAVTGYAELELKKASAKDRRALEQVLANATRATLLIQTLLDFSRNRSSSPQSLELNAVIGDVSELLKDLVGEQVELSLRLNANPSMIYADRVEVQQSVLSLLIIARNEMGRSGQLTLSTSLVELNEEFIGNEDREPGEYVALSIESNPEKRAKKTIAENRGTGSLSLDAVRDMLRDGCGLLRRSADSGGKSTLKLYFPATQGESVSEPGPTLPRNPAVARTILVVEDDDAVRVPAAEFLKMEGFKVLQARTGSEALSLAQQSRSALDILIADVFMPKMSGHEVAEKLLEEHPDLKVLYMSGDPGRQAARGAKTAASATLRKPFRLNVLRDKIHDLLGE
jgi:two-component system, cell cycle sensor histidine kinase and response regulator CckA